MSTVKRKGPRRLSLHSRISLAVFVGLIVLAVVLALWPGVANSAQLQSFERGALTIETGAGRHDFEVELADTPPRRAQGLMFRQNVAPDAGMLFVYDDDRVISMWMKNTLIPLDMLFIHADGRIESIVPDTVPHDLTPIRSQGPVRAVLELAAGSAARLGIAPGDTVRHPAFQP